MASPLRFGIAGIGNEGRRISPALTDGVYAQLAAVADRRPEAVDAFKEDHPGVSGFDSIESMCASGEVDAIWVATPNPFHAEHAIAAAEHGVHIVLEKPMCVTLDEADRMVEAVERNNVQLVLHSHASDPPIIKMREIIASGQLGRLIGIHTSSYKSWLKSPRLPFELDTSQGGGVVYRQGPHQIEIVRHLGGGMVKSVRAYTGRWHPDFATEGNFTALLEFADGIPATLVFYGYGYFNVTDLTWNISEGGQVGTGTYRKQPRQTRPADAAKFYTGTRLADRASAAEREKKQPIYGLTIVSCEFGELRQSPDGVYVYTDDGCEEIVCEPYLDAGTPVQELTQALAEGRPVFPGVRWGRATLEVILAILESGKNHQDVLLSHQVPSPL
jgi:phthalate 4,5-cis-dihydrodiol dehydrogenase